MAVVPDQATTSICTHCDRAIPSANIDLHYVFCSRNLEKCKVCGDMVPKQHHEDHYSSTHAPEVCGNQTELCHRCNKHVRLRERYNHEDSCNRIQNNGVGSSRNVRRPVERGEGARRRQPNGFSTRRLLFTIAITGITVILGSIFFQRKAETSSVH